MAVDSREKRFSFLNFGEGAHLHATFEADGTVDSDDRQHLLDCYSGIAFGPAVPLETPNIRIAIVDELSRTVSVSQDRTVSVSGTTTTDA